MASQRLQGVSGDRRSKGSKGSKGKGSVLRRTTGSASFFDLLCLAFAIGTVFWVCLK